MAISSALAGLRKAGQIQAEKAGSQPLACLVEEISKDGVRVSVLGRGPHGKPGDMLRLATMPDSSLSLDKIFSGDVTEQNGRRRIVWPSVPGDLMMFEKAVVIDGTAHVDRVATRTHVGLAGDVQILQCLVKPSKFSRTQGGMTQFASIVAPEFASQARTEADVAAFYGNILTTTWPGGSPAVMFRRGGRTLTFHGEMVGDSPETPAQFAERIASEGLLDPKAPLEMVPIWSLPVGMHQKFREGAPTPHEDKKKHLGQVTANYVERNLVHYRESFVILGREAEIKFGQPTGRRPMSVLGLHPLPSTPKILPENIPAGRRTEHPIRMFHETAKAVAAASEDRAKRRRVFLAKVSMELDPDEPVSLRF